MPEHTGPDQPNNDPIPPNRPNPPMSSPPPAARSGGRRWLPLVVAFVVGIVVGVAGWALAGSSSTTSAAGEPVTSTVTMTAPSAAQSNGASPTITLPAACKEISTDAQQIRDLLGQAVDAAKSLDATKMSTVLREMDTQQQKITDATKACTAAMPSGVGS